MAEVPGVQEQEPDEQEVEEQAEVEAEVAEPEHPEEQAEGEESPEPAPKESRANREIRALRERAQAAERKAEETAAEVARFKQSQSADAQRQAVEAEERRIAAIDDPVQRYQQQLYHWAKQRDAEQKQSQQALELRLMDQADKSAFESKAAVNPKYAKYADAVEKELANARRAGQNATREQVLIYIVGKEALNPKTSANTTKQKQQAQQRVAAARGTPTGARSDAGSGRSSRSESAAREERLRDVPL